MPQEPDFVIDGDKAILGPNTRMCPGCGRIYVLREYVNPCPQCQTELPHEGNEVPANPQPK